MPRKVTHTPVQVTPDLLSASIKNCEKLIKFLAAYRTPQNDNSGKYNIPLQKIVRLFDDTWEYLKGSSGHTKLRHKVTQVIVEYKAHDNDPVDPGAVVDLANVIQGHINTFYKDYLGCLTRFRYTTPLNLQQIAYSLSPA